ncbi:DgyrCDS9286 [Dimorphilus gyrociliatus]|uniref:Homeobox protein cut-like n=1 Tax=Dimorphilus gyrociliatus TaxID=2664684 RepID=A0A7I8VYA2_9ANNE|nr:DgyrCDS9286 [Dimorphilus gyrociliatus]
MNSGVKKESSTSQHQTPPAAVAPQAVVSQLNGFFPPPVSSLAPAALVPPAHHPAAALFFSPHLPPLLPPTHFGSIAPALLHDHLLRPPTPPTSVPSTAPPPSQSPPNDALDTADVAQKIREILSTHNIGQRLFAKHVLGLSQGTVSELLSKPKHWDKLTEKGRESYRKMHAWAASEKNVVELKAISPKKGSSPMMSNYRSEDAATEERIQKILSEAHHAMQAKHSQEKEQWNRSIVSSIYEQELAKLGENGKITNGVNSLSGQQYDAGEFTEQLVQRIYQEQLEKMIAHARKSGNVAQLNMYQAELLKVAQQVHAKGNSPHEDNKENLTDTKDEPTDLSIKKKEETLADSSPAERQSAFSIVRPESCQSNDSSSHNAMSPLQRMQNIANSLMNKGPNQGGTGGRPLKAVLPPITQEQFDKYSHIGTDELVKCVKETLSQFSISQRLFGENILGLSQGSVSDLLARPKPWHMLTQKGREPFIRMQMFLEDTESISKLVASQYRVPPEKLLRGSMGDEPPPPPPPPPPPQSTSSPAESDYRQSSSSVADSELDTLAITSKVKEVLTANNLGQKLFGEAILGLSQGSVSELLSKPKPWSMLSHKGREPFIKMHMWLQDPAKFDRLRLYQSETPAGKNSRKRKHQSAIISSNSNCCDNSASSSDNQKRPRVFFTEQQKETLRNAYASDPYPSQNVIENLANQLNVGQKTIVNWFHNHRMRAKQQQHSVSSPASSVSSSARTAAVDSDDAPSPASTASSSAGALTRPLNDAAQWLFPDFMPVKAEKAEEEEEIDEESSNMNVTVTKSNKRKAAKPKRVYERAEPERNGESWDDEDDVGSTSGLTVVAAC